MKKRTISKSLALLLILSGSCVAVELPATETPSTDVSADSITNASKAKADAKVGELNNKLGGMLGLAKSSSDSASAVTDKIKNLSADSMMADTKATLDAKKAELNAKKDEVSNKLHSKKEELTNKLGLLTSSASQLDSAKNSLHALKSGLTETGVSLIESEVSVSEGSGIDKEEIHKKLNKQVGKLTLLHKTNMFLNPNLTGNIIVKMQVSPKGKIEKSEIVSTTIENKKFGNKVLKALKKMKFSKAIHPSEFIAGFQFNN